jgi:hypothetical protein
MTKSILICLAVLAFASVCPAAETETWVQGELTDFEKANLKRVSLRSDGVLTLAPETTELFDASISYLWAIAQDSKGTIYIGGGGTGTSNTKLFAVGPDGKGRTVADLEGLEIHAIAIDRKDQVFAATSPDGKVYRISAGKPEVFYDPKAKYIWAMDFNSKGDLLIGTGDRGEIHRVTPDGKGNVLFKSEDANIRSLAIDARDNVIAGTDPGGLVLRLSPQGQGFVLYQTAKREVTAVAVSKAGAIYASAVGLRQPTAPAVTTPTLQVGTPPPPATGQQPALSVRPAAPTAPPSAITAIPSVTGGSEVYRIDTDGYPRKVWVHPQEIVYAIGFDANNRALLGTGNKGNIYRLDTPTLYTLVSNVSPTQITGFLSGPQGKIYAITGNLGKLYQIGPALERDGTVESDILDASSFTYWGRLAIKGTPSAGRYTIETRSGNLDRPQQNWSAWQAVPLTDGSGRIASPPARFLQWKLTLTQSGDGRAPEVSSIEAAYQPKNVPPAIQVVEATPPNYRFPAPAASANSSNPPNITLPPLGGRRRDNATPPITLESSGSSASLQYAKNHIGARWLASDENGDGLIFKVEIRGSGESEWKLLKDKVNERHMSWDTTSFPDGEYRVRVTASDAPSNPPAQALTAQLESEPFVIDNTPPQVTGLSAMRTGAQIRVRWSAKDARNVIRKAEYSIDGGDWAVVEPETRLSDSPEHAYVLTLDGLDAGEHTVAVRVSDSYDNQTVEKAIVK